MKASLETKVKVTKSIAHAHAIAEAYDEAENHLRACAGEETEDQLQKAAYITIAEEIKKMGEKVFDRLMTKAERL